MSDRAVLGSVVLTFLLASGARAQDPIPVRPIEDVTALERVGIAVARALVPGSRVIVPLYAYERDIACGSDGHDRLGEHDGYAAIVSRGGTIVAYYYRNTRDAVAAAQQRWCNDHESDWLFATSSSLGDDAQEVERYITRDVTRVDAQLRRD
ncbi:MAG: hypothetical protein OXH75_29735 [Acidobacteria bacterium]|nr:hypothetical protein [Acidobacteriota bacterium]